jgi:hypothetical protein
VRLEGVTTDLRQGRRPALERTPQLLLRQPTEAEHLVVDEDAGGEHHPAALREPATVLAAEVDLLHHEREVARDARQNVLRLVAQSAVLLREQRDAGGRRGHAFVRVDRSASSCGTGTYIV